MSYICYRDLGEKDLISNIVAPEIKSPGVTLGKAISLFGSKKYYHRSCETYVLKAIPATKLIDSITIKDTLKLKSTIKDVKKFYSIRAHLIGLIRFVKLGKYSVERKSRNGNSPVRLKVAFAGLDKLSAMAVAADTGRFSALMLDVKRAIEQCPPDQFAIIQPSKIMATDEKERESTRVEIRNMLNKFHKGWIVKWIKGDEVFIITTLDNWRKAMGKEVKK